MIRIAKVKNRIDYNLFCLIAVIEIQRHVEGNPDIPERFKNEYMDSLKEVPDLIKMISNDKWDNSLTSSVIAALAISKGHIKLGKVILDLEA